MSRKPIFCVVKECIEKIESVATVTQTNPQKTNEGEAVKLMTTLTTTLSSLLNKLTGGQIRGIGAPRSMMEFNNVLEQINKEVMGYYKAKLEEAKKMMAAEDRNVFAAETSIQRDGNAEFMSGISQLRVSIQKMNDLLVVLIPLEGVGKEIVRMLNFAEQLKTVTSPQNKDDFLTLIKTLKNVSKKMNDYNVEYMAFDMLGAKLTLPLHIQDFSLFRQSQQVAVQGGSELQDKIEELQGKLQKITRDNVKLKREVQTKQKECDELNEMNNTLTTQVKEMEETVKMLNNKCKNYQSHGQTDMNNLKQLEEKQKAEMEEIRGELEALLNNLREQNRQETAFDDSLIEEVEHHRKSMLKLQDECDRLKLQLAEYRNGHQNANALQEELIRYKSMYEQAEREKQRAVEENYMNQQVIKEMREKEDQINQTRESSFKEVEDLKAQLEETKRQVEEKDVIIASRESSYQETVTYLNQIIEGYNILFAQNQQFQAQIVELTNRLNGITTPQYPSQPGQYPSQPQQPGQYPSQTSQGQQQYPSQPGQQSNPYPSPSQSQQQQYQPQGGQVNTMSTPNCNNVTTSTHPYTSVQPPQKPSPEVLKYPIPIRYYYFGGDIPLTVKGQSFTLKVDPFTQPGLQIPLADMGDPVNGMKRDLILQLDIEPDNTYRREGDNLVQTVVLSRQYQGMKVSFNIKLITDQDVPYNGMVQDGLRSALQGYGFQRQDGTKGDYIIEIRLQ